MRVDALINWSDLHLGIVEFRKKIAAPGVAGMLDADLAAGRLAKPNFQISDLQTRYGIRTLKGRSLSPAAEKFVPLLRAAEAELVRAESNSPLTWMARGSAMSRRRRHRR